MNSNTQPHESFILDLSQKIQGKDLIPAFKVLSETQNELIIKGQGTITTVTNGKPFSISVRNLPEEVSAGYDLVVKQDCAIFYCYEQGKATELHKCETKLDSSESCCYWFSLDLMNRRLVYGIGEQRIETKLMNYCLESSMKWIDNIQYINIDSEDDQPIKGEVYRDPVTIEPPLLVVPTNEMTMEMAAKYEATVVENLTFECQKLYANIVGDLFQLNTPDFPNFSDAIAKSIQDPQGWCYLTLKKKEKDGEFGKADPLATYLRITLGTNQGESPGIPYVMEIWPSKHYSPIHNHAGANAIIKVLHGNITVKLFDMLSPSHTKPFKEVTIGKGDVTWITPKLNQTHQLYNQNEDEPCVTIQCYLYSAEDKSHYEYFDYIKTDTQHIEHFLPNSDMDFLNFKQQMKKEWEPVPIYLYKAENPPRYYYTTNSEDSPGKEWTQTGIAFYAFQKSTVGAVPAYQFSASSPQRYDFRTDSTPARGWINDGKSAFYVLPDNTANFTPVYQYHQIMSNGSWNLFYSLDRNDPSVKGWSNDGVVFYVY